MQAHPFIKSLISSEQARILRNIEKIQANLEFKELLTLKTFTEINIGTLTPPNSMELKRIDLMICDGERVIIIDYKSDIRPAANINNVPPAYVEQLAHYKQICQLIYPSKQILTKILWLENGKLMDIHN
jgi:ATP-dependent helicase/nuclease subunit A